MDREIKAGGFALINTEDQTEFLDFKARSGSVINVAAGDLIKIDEMTFFNFESSLRNIAFMT